MTTKNSSSKKSNASKKTAQAGSKSVNYKKQSLSAQQKKNIEHLLNNLTMDAAVTYKEDGSVSIHIAPWHDAANITEQPKTIRGRMVYGGKYNEGDGGKFIPYNQGGASIFTTILKTPHGELKTTPKRVQVQFSFWKSEGKMKTMTELYKEVMQMKQFVKAQLAKYGMEQALGNLNQPAGSKDPAFNGKEGLAWEEMK